MATPRDPLTGKFLKPGEEPISQEAFEELQAEREAKRKANLKGSKPINPETGKQIKTGGRQKGSVQSVADKKRTSDDNAKIKRIEAKMRKEFLTQLEKDGRIMLKGTIEEIKENLIDPLVELSNFYRMATNQTERLEALRLITPYLYSKQAEKKELEVTGSINYEDARNKVQQLLDITPIEGEVVTEKDDSDKQ